MVSSLLVMCPASAWKERRHIKGHTACRPHVLMCTFAFVCAPAETSLAKKKWLSRCALIQGTDNGGVVQDEAVKWEESKWFKDLFCLPKHIRGAVVRLTGES